MVVDLVVPYVDMNDPNWIELAKENNINISPNRFRGQGDFFKYFFRGIDKNMPWINNIFLLVQSESQVPTWLDRTKVKVILHSEFIPEQFLPVYNSCAIEMFIHNIPGLSEHFIYSNDDMYVVNKLSVDRFFSEDKVYQHFYNNSNDRFLCGKINDNSYKLVFNDDLKFVPSHHFKPLIKSKCIEFFEANKDKIYESITKTRNWKNLNVYMYVYYLKELGLSDESNIKLKLIFTWDLAAFIVSWDVICINDNLEDNVYEDIRLNERFSKMFSEKSKYEL